MPDTLLFAKKLTLPSRQANTLQSLNMAAAFQQAGADVFFYPGLKCDAPSPVEYLAQYGIDAADTAHWTPLGAPSKGLYGLSYRLHAAVRYIRGVKYVLARDVGDAVFVSALKRLVPGQKGKKCTFLFEMHEILYAMHQRNPGRQDWRATMEREKRIMRQADGLVLLNAALEKPVRESLGFSGPLIVEPNGFNPALFFPLPLFATGVPWPGAHDPLTLVYIGGMHKGKGVPELVRAMNELPERFRLRIIGGGSDAALRELEELRAVISGGAERIRFTGRVPQSALRSVCAGAHIAVIPQQPDSDFFSPIKLFEYLALGLPVICTPLALFRDNQASVYLAKDATAKGIAAAVEELAANPALARQLRIRGLQDAATHTWRARARRIFDFAGSLR